MITSTFYRFGKNAFLRSYLIIAVLHVAFIHNVSAGGIQNLFIIERSKNANVVVYDLRLNDRGEPAGKDTIDAYWMRYAGTGERRELKWYERSWAYGTKIKGPVEADGFDMVVRAYDDRLIQVRKIDGEYRPLMKIKDELSVLDKIYVASDESGALPKVLYIKLYGHNRHNGQPVVEEIAID